MLNRLTLIIALVFVALAGSPARADEYTDTVTVFKNAGESGNYFKTAYGYAVFPTIVKGAFIVGGARGAGRVYAKGQHVGDSTMTQATVGLQMVERVTAKSSSSRTNARSRNLLMATSSSAPALRRWLSPPPPKGRRALPAHRPARARVTITRRPPATTTRAWRRSSSPRAG
jgi:hypothetical protein